jgi:putative transposase
MRYTERNALRANLVKRAQDWCFGSLWIQEYDSTEHRVTLSDWPAARPRNWAHYVNQPATDAELEAIRRSCRRGSPYGSAAWIETTARKLGLESTLRSPGRPKQT